MFAFTFGSDIGMNALVAAMQHTTTRDPLGIGIVSRYEHTESFDMQLNTGDFEAVVYALRELALSHGDCDDTCQLCEQELPERAWSLLSAIAETFDIEFI